MTKEEAKKIFLNRGYIEVLGGTYYYDADKWRESIAVISKWLEQEPCDDCISRQEAILQVQKYGVGCFDAEEFSPEQCERFVISKLNSLPSVTPNKREMNMEDKECEKCEHHDYCAWLHEYQDFGIVCNEYKEQSSNEEVTPPIK